MSIKIKRNEQGNCINFEGSSNPTYWNACLSGEVDSTDIDTVNVVNDIITATSGVKQYEFYRVPFTDFTDRDGNSFTTAQECADYITAQANVVGLGGSGTELTDVITCVKLDDTSTSIMFDNGHVFGVNTIKAVDTGDGLITIKSELGDITHFTKLDPLNVCDGDGVSIPGGLNDVINYLNELFTVGAFEAIVIADPYSTMIADVSGVDTSVNYVGYGLDPVGNDVFGSTNSNSQNGLKTVETIDQAGEFFTFDIRVEGTIGFGLIHSQDSYDDGYWSGYQPYADPAQFGIVNSAHSGFQFSHWFHQTPNGSWTNYGANTSYSMRAGWSNFNGTTEQADWLAGNPIKVRCGIDTNGFISIETLRNGTDWVVHARTSYPVQQGSEFHLGIKTNSTEARVYSLPKVHLLEPAAPVMNFRFIESPDNNFEYPLFSTEEEANYYDEQNGGTGTSHTHTYTDDPTSTTWYMPDTNGEMSGTSAPATDSTLGQPASYTEITSLSNSDLTPEQFSSADITQEEGTNVNIQVTPAGASWSTSVAITPSGSGLVYDGYSVIQGTLTDVGEDTTYTISVTRANAYGSTTGNMTVTATDVAPAQTNDTPWTKALDFNGGSEHTKQVSNSMYTQPMQMAGIADVKAGNSTAGYTSDASLALPWATSCVFKADRHNSNQVIWNQGEGSSNGDDNISLALDSNGDLSLQWGRQGTGVNKCRIAQNISSSNWYGVYIAHSGERLGGGNASASNLAGCFDIRLMSSSDSFVSISSNLSVASNWIQTGQRMDRTIAGDFTIGGRGNSTYLSYHGKVASMLVSTLKQNQAFPTTTEIDLMITDPIKWVDDYKVGQDYRGTMNNGTTSNFQKDHFLAYRSTMLWLMGDSTNDSYSNGMRNYLYPIDQNWTKMQLNSMVSNDIETVNINGLT
jgi:hypothetical protein